MTIRSIVPPVGANWTEWHRARDAEITHAALAWVGQLAARFERYASDFDATGRDIGLKLAEVYRGHAAELRERAKERR